MHIADNWYAWRLRTVPLGFSVSHSGSYHRADLQGDAADTLVSGYLLPFFEWNLWGILPTTIIVLVAINQPFTLWMLHSFFQSIPKELDESAKADGCTQFQAFRFVIIPLMWPGVITTGLFSFLLAYNDFAVTSMLLSDENRTMVPKIAAFLGTTYTEGNVMFAVAAVVSATAPLFILVMFFQRRIVSGLTAGAVKDKLVAKRSRPEQAALSRNTDMSKTEETRKVIEGMVDGLNDHRIDDIGAFFADTFRWIGNQGCGTKSGLREFQDNWQRPFQASFSDKVSA